MRHLPFYHVKFNPHNGKWQVLRRTNIEDSDQVVATYMTRQGAREEAKQFNELADNLEASRRVASG